MNHTVTLVFVDDLNMSNTLLSVSYEYRYVASVEQEAKRILYSRNNWLKGRKDTVLEKKDRFVSRW